MVKCRVCGGSLTEFIDFGQQPLSDAFLPPDDIAGEFFFRLAVGLCADCTMVQLMEEVPRERMFHDEYPYVSSGSVVMREHFEATARQFLATELSGPDPFIVEIGSNDGVMLRTIDKAGVRHLGVEPSGSVAELARMQGIQVLNEFFEASSAVRIRAEHGPAQVVYAANTMCHIPYAESIFRGLDALLAPDGVFVFEDPYLGEIVDRTSFDQIYDEHFYFFTARSVAAMAERFGFQLVDVRRLPVHGGEVRYTLARAGVRTPTAAVADLLAEEAAAGLADLATFQRFAAAVRAVRDDLLTLLRRLKAEGRVVGAYGATAKSATVTNYCGITPDLVAYVLDTTPAKQGRLTPGAHLPVRPAQEFRPPYPDYLLLFAWNHAEEIMAKEQSFRDAGGRWILYTPKVHLR
ncbi:class I SAM-dependent methyltransferase [Micromonospora halophytica]|uniref:Methylation protein EvaC n=1 Tax=Micromonospora halophytica TaxID=47864 RepID=A0A1C5IJV2_9ACTN|nr:class I SAM-dependent methyltransferase [Micromonospora halophytica]SCG58617.1 methylation protein EvaC [Micromonospora halophytica]